MKRRDVLRRIAGAATGALAPLPLARGIAADANPLYLTQPSAAYERHRTVFNKRIVRTPKLIAVCRTESDVVRAVHRARSEGLATAIKSGGHSFEGFSLNDNGMVIDLSTMNSLMLSADRRLLATPGCTLSEVYGYLVPRGLLLPAGTCEGVGLAGLTLGGGYGFFSRRHGLTCDNLARVRLIDANGDIHDSRDEPDLLWACRGGATAGIGVVTLLEYDVHAAPRALHSFRYRHRVTTPRQSIALAARWMDAVRKLPLETYSAFVANGTVVTLLVVSYLPKPNDGRLSPILAALAANAIRSDQFVDEPLLAGLRRYTGQKGPLYFKNSSGGCYDDIATVEAAGEMIFEEVLRQRGVIFQINSLGPLPTASESAFPHRKLAFIGELQAYWDRPEAGSQAMQTMQRLQLALTADGVQAHYANYPDLNIADWPRAYYGQHNYARLQVIKQRLDPNDLFRHPQSITLPA